MKLNKIGVQLYSIRGYLDTEEQVKVSFDKLKKMGYDEVQTAGCVIPYKDFGRLAMEAGIDIVGTHDNFAVMVNTPELAMENHDYLDTKIMGIGGFFGKTKEEYVDFIAKANTVAAAIKDRGFKFTYHNHSHEFRKVDGKLIMDMLIEGMDPANTGFVLDTYWVQHGGGDVRYWIEKLAGRVDILHLKDMLKTAEGAPQAITEVGNGNLYWEGILETAFKTGVKHFVVEQDNAPDFGDPFECLKRSSEYLHANFF
ncbi:MAG: sugar phosphate isomerase/epimerase [Clostridia bacterium]|nr:sugar phosphate isomerase/epimerase [Clostridia bacterium]